MSRCVDGVGVVVGLGLASTFLPDLPPSHLLVMGCGVTLLSHSFACALRGSERYRLRGYCRTCFVALCTSPLLAGLFLSVIAKKCIYSCGLFFLTLFPVILCILHSLCNYVPHEANRLLAHLCENI